MPAQSHPAVLARRRRVTAIRQSVLATAVAVFVAAFSTMYVQMASGNDPALGSSVVHVASTAADSSATPTQTQTQTQTQAQAPVQTEQPSAVTTQQS
jgi:hypothetical protein